MSDWAIALSLIAVSLGILLVVIAICRALKRWSIFRSCFNNSNGEETTHLTKNGHFETNGYLLNSESDIVLDVSGNYKHYDNVGNDLKLVPDLDFKESTNQLLSSQPCPAQVDEKEFGKEPCNGNCDKNILFFEKPDIPALKKAISCDSVSSSSSVATETPESPHRCGELELGIEYDSETEDVIVIINRIRDFLSSSPNNVVDTFIKVALLPDQSANMQTRVCRKSNEPVFKERFLFGVDENDLSHRSLLCTVFTSDKLSSSLVGEAEVKLGTLDLQQPYWGWFPIIDSNQGPAELGDIMFSLSYLPTAERLTVVVVKARNLRWKKSLEANEFNPFVKVYLLKNGKKVTKKKTTVKKSEKNPIFSEAMIFSVPCQALQNSQLRVTVADNQGNGKTPSVGHVVVGPLCKGKSLSHWNQMMSSLRKPVAMWHPLKKLSDF